MTNSTTIQTTETKPSYTDLETEIEQAIEAISEAVSDIESADVEKEGGLDAALEAGRAYVAACEALETARAALDSHIDAGGEATWLCDDGNAEVECTGTMSAAAQEYVDGGDWGDSSSEDYACVIHVYCQAKYLPDRSRDSESVALEQDEPECTHDDGHDWQSPQDLVGGIKENPGVWGNGGGVVVYEACVHCGCRKTTDTLAQDSTDGTRYTKVSYEPEYYDLTERRIDAAAETIEEKLGWHVVEHSKSLLVVDGVSDDIDDDVATIREMLGEGYEVEPSDHAGSCNSNSVFVTVA